MANEPDYRELERWAKEAESGDAGSWSEYVESLSRVGVLSRSEGILNTRHVPINGVWYEINPQPEPESYEPCGEVLNRSGCLLPRSLDHRVHSDGSHAWASIERGN